MTAHLYAGPGPGESAETLRLTVAGADDGLRIDRALANAASGRPGLSRSRLGALIAAARVTGPDGAPVADPAAKARGGATYEIALPPPAQAEPEPEPIPLAVLHEDAHLVVVDKPAGMVVHPAPGAESGTLVNALLAHCGASLSGIGGTRRPGIVHRIDKDTSGLLVVAKTAAAQEGLAAQFAARTVSRRYLAVAWGAPDRADPRLAGLPAVTPEPGGLRIETLLDRHPTDRTRMAVRPRGRRAVTRIATLERFGGAPGAAALASLLACRLETGRTHQIRVHAAHVGHPLVGDPVYGRARAIPRGVPAEAAAALGGFPRQALHAAELGFEHPATGRRLDFESPLPEDMARLLGILRRTLAGLR